LKHRLPASHALAAYSVYLGRSSSRSRILEVLRICQRAPV
jgi:hypothetical protein